MPMTKKHAPEDHRAEFEELTHLLPLWPHELADTSLTGRQRIVAVIERALRAERRRGQAGHWAYDLARHASLYRVWQREHAALAHHHRQARAPNTNGPPEGEPS
jgi:hypothetical protein